MSKRIVIVGGVAAGASAAAKARRTSEEIKIVLIEAGPYISFANCGLPYYVGGEIPHRESLFAVKPELFAKRFDIELWVNTRVTSVDPLQRTVSLQRSDGAAEELSYDRLILATGTTAIVPPIKGIHRDNIFTVRTVPDVDAICAHLQSLAPVGREAHEAKAEAPLRAVVIGGGYIGLETAEQLLKRGLKVTVVELADQLMLALDKEIADPLREALVKAGCKIILSEAVSEVAERDGQSLMITQAGRELPFEIGILAAGVRPNVELAKSAGLTLGRTGAIQVDSRQRTSEPTIYAAGDNSETRHMVLDRPVNIPLAGPANKAGRVAGANAALDLAGAAEDEPRRLVLRGVLGTAVVRVGEANAAVTGLTEAHAKAEGVDYRVVYMPGVNHAGYYPGAENMLLKILHDPGDGRLLGAQAVGGAGVDKRIDVLATAIAGRMTVEDLEHLDLCYAPPFGTAKDIVVLGGFAAANARRGEMPFVTPAELLDELAGDDPPMVIDVRTPKEYAAGHLLEAVNIPVDEIRARIKDVPTDRPVVVHCGAGYRSYVTQRVLMNNGYDNVRNILGGYGLIERFRRLREDS